MSDTAANARLHSSQGVGTTSSGAKIAHVSNNLVSNEAHPVEGRRMNSVLGQVIERSRRGPSCGLGPPLTPGNLKPGPCIEEGMGSELAVNPGLQDKESRRVAPGFRATRPGTFGQLAAGGIAGAVSKTCTAPLARLTILLQVQGMHADGVRRQHTGVLHEAARIFREEGVRAFWKGNMVTIVHRLPYSSINFFAYERYKMMLMDYMNAEEGDQSLGAGMGTRLVAGGGAGITAASMTYPLDLVRTRLAAQTKEVYYRGIVHALSLITRDEGYRGLYKGMGATLMGVGPSIAINFCVYDTLKTTWMSRKPETSQVVVSLGCGSVAGIASSTATFPLDLVRRRMQLEGAGGRARIYRTGLFGTFKQILRTDGLWGMYRGIIPEYIKVVPGVSIAFMTYEQMKRLLRPPSEYD